MATLPADRTKLALAQGNQVASTVASASKNINAMTEAYDTIDALYNFTTGLISAGTLSRLGIINVKDYNASGSANTYTGTIASGSQTLTLTTSSHDFVAGQGISIPGAGAAAATLVTTVSAVSGATVTVATAASTTATAVTVSHDDTVAIQAAITAAGVNGGEVTFPCLTYKVTSTIVISELSNIHLVGNGSTITLPFYEDFIDIFRVRLSDNISIQGFTLIGTKGVGSTWEQSYGIEVNRSQNIHLSDLEISDFQGDGIIIGSSVAWGFTDTTENVTITNVNVSNCYRNQISLVYGENVTINNCDLTSTEDGYVSSLDIETHHEDDIIQNVRILNSIIPWMLIDAWQKTTTTKPINGVFIDNTTIQRLEGHNSAAVKISNSDVSDLYFEGVIYNAVQQKCHDLSITGSSIGKIHLIHARYVRIKGNFISKKSVFVLEAYRGWAAVTECGIYSSVLGYSLIADNIFVDCIGRSVRLGSIVTTFPEGFCVISNNAIGQIDETVANGLNFEGVCSSVVVGVNHVVGITTACNVASLSSSNYPRLAENYSDDLLFNEANPAGPTRPASHIKRAAFFLDTVRLRPSWWSGTTWLEPGMYVSVPASATAAGYAGNWSADSSYLYICHATNTWKRVAIATW